MKESFWAVLIVTVGIICIYFVFFFQSLTNSSEHNYNLLKETTKAAMIDSIDVQAYRAYGLIKIDKERFVTNFMIRFAKTANLSRTYKIEIFDVNEVPPKVSIRVSSKEGANFTGEIMDFDIVNKLDAILETPY